MTLPVLERSTFDGKPVELFEFVHGATAWRWTNAEQSIPFLSWTFQPTQIGRSAARETEERGSRDLVVYVPRDNPLAAALMAGSIATDVEVRIYLSHRGLATADLLWRGRVAGVAISGSQAEIRCIGINAYTDKAVPRLAISRTCPLMLYEPQCGVNQAAFTHAATVVDVDGLDVTVSGAPHLDPMAGGYDADYYAAGMLISGTHVGFIEKVQADVLTLMNPVPLTVGLGVQLVAGCDRTFETCRARFANSKRWLGFKFLPLRNPFNGRLD